MFRIGKTEEGRDMIAVVVADEATIKSARALQGHHRDSSPTRARTPDAEARQLIAQGKPIYYATGAMHSPETGSPEMLMELAYRLAVEETPFIQADPQHRHLRLHADPRGGRPRQAGGHAGTTARRPGRRCR